MNWMEGLQSALDYIEAHLTDELSAEDVAAQAYLSVFYFQRIFSALCGITLGEYIRSRRLTQAAQELTCGDVKVIDVALRYGYDSPDSFARAFTRFHGVSPSAAKEKGVRLNAFAPMKLRLIMEGGTMLEYRIEEKAAFTLMGVRKEICADVCYEDIPAFWDEHLAGPLCNEVIGTFGLCTHDNPDRLEYWIGDLYTPWEPVPEGCGTFTLPACTWAVFPCRGKLPEALQSVNTRIWQEWLPACREYKLGGSYNIEMYAPPAEKPENTYSEIWIPVVRV